MIAARWLFSVGLMCALVPWLVCQVLCAEEEAKQPASASAAPAGAYSPSGNSTLEITPAVSTPQATSPVPAADGKPGAMPSKPETPGQPSTKAEAEKSKEPIKPIHRPSAPETPPNPDEFKVRPDAAGKIRLNFNGQPWQPVLEWLAKISNMSLDWQELPGDSINLSTQRSYTVAEVRDLLNRLLLARGFTLLSRGEVLTVAEIKNLDPSLVPRIDAADLSKRDPHEFVKVSFPLGSLAAETAAEELKPMVSPNGWLTPLNETNRLEVMDAVTNLRDIDAVLRQQAEDSQPRSFREFKLKNTRAGEVHRLLATLLGIESKSPAGFDPSGNGMNPGQQAAMMAAMQQGQPGGMPGQQMPNGGPTKPKGAMAVTMVVNERNNSLLVRASPDKMAVIAQVVDAVDIPVSHDDSLLVNMNRMQVYRLSGIDPEPVVKTLMEIGNLDPATRLEVDKKNSAVIAYAPLADHVTIRAVVDKLTGSERKFEVIRLRRLAADYVAGTIDLMMGSGKKEKTRSNPFFFGDSQQRDGGENSKAFHVEADVENNRLLLWANPVELTAVETLLAKLGENPAAGSGSSNIRVIDGGDAQETQELIERIRRAWPSIAPNALQAPAAASTPEGSKEPVPRLPSPHTDTTSDSPTPSPLPDRLPNPLPKPSPNPLTNPLPSSAAGQAQAALFLADVPRTPADSAAVERAADDRTADDHATGERAADESVTAAARPAPPPVKITVGPDGKLIVSSLDGLALDRLEELAAQLATPRKDFRVFHLKYASAFGVSLNLEDYFKEEKKEPSRPMPWWYDYGSDSQKDSDSDRRLSKRRKLTFISDTDSNTILVEGASSDQLKTIDELIQVYDQPPPRDTQSVRRTEVVRLKFSKAKAVADTVKDVYRDLLSPDDKALASNNPGRETRRTIIFDSGDSDNSEHKTPKFKGLLSIGVDEISNSLTISAPAYLFEHVTKLINDLDQAAAPDYTVRMVKVEGMSAARIKELLDRVYRQKSGELPPAEERPAAKPAAPAKKPANPAAGSTGGAGSQDKDESH